MKRREVIDPKRDLAFHPLTPGRWVDLVHLFGARGACAGCWCMWWRLSASAWKAKKGPGTRRLMRNLVQRGARPGILAYRKGDPVAWCAIAPRVDYRRLAHSRILRPVDKQPVWSVVCLFVSKPCRRLGLTPVLLRAAVRFAAQLGAQVVEGYPIEPRGEYVDAFASCGIATAFREAGFREVARRSATRPIMRVITRPRGRTRLAR